MTNVQFQLKRVVPSDVNWDAATAGQREKTDVLYAHVQDLLLLEHRNQSVVHCAEGIADMDFRKTRMDVQFASVIADLNHSGPV